jgi:hypothetical protein
MAARFGLAVVTAASRRGVRTRSDEHFDPAGGPVLMEASGADLERLRAYGMAVTQRSWDLPAPVT